MKEFFQEIAKNKGLVLVIIGVVLLIFGAASGIQIGQNSLAINPTYQIMIILVGGFLILAGVTLIVLENVTPNRGQIVLGKKTESGFLKKLDEFYGESITIKKELAEATHIDIMGYSLISFLLAYRESIVQAVLKGAKVRMIVINPDSKVIDIMRDLSPSTSIRSDIQRSIHSATYVANKSKTSLKGDILVRLVDWIPSCSLIITDPEKEIGIIRVGVYTPHYKSPSDNRVFMKLSQKKEKYWFDIYAEEFELLWAESKPYELSGK
jgi:hypothetical protein